MTDLLEMSTLCSSNVIMIIIIIPQYFLLIYQQEYPFLQFLLGNCCFRHCLFPFKYNRRKVEITSRRVYWCTLLILCYQILPCLQVSVFILFFTLFVEKKLLMSCFFSNSSQWKGSGEDLLCVNKCCSLNRFRK